MYSSSFQIIELNSNSVKTCLINKLINYFFNSFYNYNKMDKKLVSEKKKSTNQENSLKKDLQMQKGIDFIHSIIHEYLMKNEYFKTLDIFQVYIL